MNKEVDIFCELNRIAFCLMENDPYHDIAVRPKASFIVTEDRYCNVEFDRNFFNDLMKRDNFTCFVINVTEFVGDYPYGTIEQVEKFE